VVAKSKCSPSQASRLHSLKSAAAFVVKSDLFAQTADLSELPPSRSRLTVQLENLRDVRADFSCFLQFALDLLRKEMRKACSDDDYYREVMKEYRRVLNDDNRGSLHPCASEHWTRFPEIFKTACPNDKAIPCPFSESYCPHPAMGKCDHIACALRVASRLSADIAKCMFESETERTARQRRWEQYERAHLATWVSHMANLMLQRVQTKFYASVALTILALCPKQ
jgi:hypothetical protein